MEKSKLRNEDERLMGVVNDLLDHCVYSKPCFSSVVRCNDTDEQRSGVDIRFKYDGHEYICDEKAAVRYINKTLNTFSFELSFINRKGEIGNGWLISEREKNDSFMLVWVNKANSDHPKSYRDIVDAEWMLIPRRAVMLYIEKSGYDTPRLITKDESIRLENDTNFGDMRVDGLKFSYSLQLIEEPINVIIPRYQLRHIAVASGNVCGVAA